MTFLECSNVSVIFGKSTVLDGISFSIPLGSIAAVMGPNGSGKTTLLNVLSGHLRPSIGNVRFGTQTLSGKPRYLIARLGVFRSFQEGQLFDSLTVEENIGIAFRPAPNESVIAALIPGLSNHVERQAATTAALQEVDMMAFRDFPAAAISYGMRKRTIMGQAIISAPVICILDEPLAGVDLESRLQMLDVIAKLRNPDRIVLFVEHDIQAVQSLADQVFLLDQGRLVATGRPEELLSSKLVLETYLGYRPC